MKKIEFAVKDKEGRWTTEECFVSGKVKIDISIKQPAVDIALKKRTGLCYLAF